MLAQFEWVATIAIGVAGGLAVFQYLVVPFGGFVATVRDFAQEKRKSPSRRQYE